MKMYIYHALYEETSRSTTLSYFKKNMSRRHTFNYFLQILIYVTIRSSITFTNVTLHFLQLKRRFICLRFLRTIA